MSNHLIIFNEQTKEVVSNVLVETVDKVDLEGIKKVTQLKYEVELVAEKDFFRRCTADNGKIIYKGKDYIPTAEHVSGHILLLELVRNNPEALGKLLNDAGLLESIKEFVNSKKDK